MGASHSSPLFEPVSNTGVPVARGVGKDARIPSLDPCGDPRRVGQVVRDLAALNPHLLSPSWPTARWSHGRITRRLWLEGEILSWLHVLGPKLAARTGISLRRQLQQLRALAFEYRLEPRAYYMLELYRSSLESAAPSVLGRYESKNWLFKALNRHRKWQRGEGSERTLRDKLRFRAYCAAHDIPTAAVLMSASKGVVTWRCERAELDRDLFVKPRYGRGAVGTATWRRINGLLYLDSEDIFHSLGAVMRDLARRSCKAKMIVQPKLVNHPLLADVAGRSLAVVRVITCLDRHGTPVVTHGMLRVLGKLEPDWPTELEFGAPVDVATGVLGSMTGDKRFRALDWHDRHPVTGVPIRGRPLPCWPEIAAAARAAHAIYPERVVVGWDIALTPDGVVILEGNSRADVAFLQRVHRTPIGDSPLGPLLLHHVRVLETHLRAGGMQEPAER